MMLRKFLLRLADDSSLNKLNCSRIVFHNDRHVETNSDLTIQELPSNLDLCSVSVTDNVTFDRVVLHTSQFVIIPPIPGSLEITNTCTSSLRRLSLLPRHLQFLRLPVGMLLSCSFYFNYCNPRKFRLLSNALSGLA